MMIDLQVKVKTVADLVWSKLTGVFAKDILHAQVSLHISPSACTMFIHAAGFNGLPPPSPAPRSKTGIAVAGVTQLVKV